MEITRMPDSVKAMERKIERGDWQEGKVWKLAPDGRIVIDVLGYQRWVESPKAAVASHPRGPEGQRTSLPVHRKQLQEIKQRIAAGAFVFQEEFPDYRFIENLAGLQKRRTCDQVFDEFLLACESRVAKKDLAFVTARGYAKLLAQIWRPEIGPRIFDEVRYSELAKIASAYQWPKKTYNNLISVVRCAFDYGYRDHPEKHNPASGLKTDRL